MRICVIGLRGIPGVMGGVETHCEQLYPRIKKLRPRDDIVIVGRRRYIEDDRRDYGGVRVQPLFALKSRYFEAISNALIGVLHARFRLHADILHIHAIGPALVTPLAKALGMKVIVTHHGDDYARAKWNFAARTALRIGEHVGVLFADHVIPVSSSVTRRLQAQYPRRSQRLEHIPNGADHERDSAAHPPGDARDRFGLRGLRYALCVGRLVPEKRVEDVIDAFRLNGAFDRLVVVGAGEQNSDYADALMRRSGPDVIFTGRLPREDVDQLLEGAALFVLASSHEGNPIVALEAIRAGAPVLLSDIAPNRDLDLAPSVYFAMGDVHALADAMRRPTASLRVDPNVLRRFAWGDISLRTNAIYDRLAAPPASPKGASL